MAAQIAMRRDDKVDERLKFEMPPPRENRQVTSEAGASGGGTGSEVCSNGGVDECDERKINTAGVDEEKSYSEETISKSKHK